MRKDPAIQVLPSLTEGQVVVERETQKMVWSSTLSDFANLRSKLFIAAVPLAKESASLNIFENV